jgi:probable F420-dependent oxidoreductase
MGSGRALAERLGRVGPWSFSLQNHRASDEQAAVAELERCDYPVIWIPESIGSKEAFAHASLLLAGTTRLTVATGIANLWARDPMAMANGAKALAEAYPGRLVLGIGVSHAPSVATRGSRYARPLERMRSYLDAMDAASYKGPEPDGGVPRVLAALGPAMLRLAAERTDGVLTYFVPVEHTARAREVLGPDPLLAVEQTAVLTADAGRARAVARAFAADYLALPNYANNLRRLGWAEDDLTGGGSDRMIDAVIVHGESDAITDRIREHLDAGADHVCVQFRQAGTDDDPMSDLCLDDFAQLAEQWKLVR